MKRPATSHYTAAANQSYSHPPLLSTVSLISSPLGPSPLSPRSPITPMLQCQQTALLRAKKDSLARAIVSAAKHATSLRIVSFLSHMYVLIAARRGSSLCVIVSGVNSQRAVPRGAAGEDSLRVAARKPDRVQVCRWRTERLLAGVVLPRSPGPIASLSHTYHGTDTEAHRKPFNLHSPAPRNSQPHYQLVV